jgi:DinB superfamily
MPSSLFSDVLRQTVEAAGARLRKIDDKRASAKPGPGRWSRKEILGHLIDSASNNHQRFVRAQLSGELRFPAYEQEGWARVQDCAHADWNALITLWQSYNEHLAHVVSKIPPDRLGTRCWIGNNEAVTLGYLVEDYLTHMRHHLKQLDRAED